MNLSSIKPLFSFHSFWHLFPFHFTPLSLQQCGEGEKGKSAQKFMKSYISKQIQKLKFFQSWSLKFNPIEVALIQIDRVYSEGVKDESAGRGKSLFLNLFGYKSFNTR